MSWSRFLLRVGAVSVAVALFYIADVKLPACAGGGAACNPGGGTTVTFERVLEEYRHDAPSRRVIVRSRVDVACTGGAAR